MHKKSDAIPPTTLTLTIIFLIWASIFLYTPTLSSYALSKGASETMIGWIVGVFGLAQALFRLPIGLFSDLIGKRVIFLRGGLLLSMVSAFGMAFFNRPINLLFFRGITGLAIATWPILIVFYSSFQPVDQQPSAVARANSFNGLGNVLGMLFGGVLVGLFSQREAFIASGLLAFTGLVLSFWIKEGKAHSHVRSAHPDVKMIFKDKHLWILALLAFSFQIVITGTSISFTPLRAQAIGATPFILGLLSMLSMSGLLISGYFRNNIVAKIGSVRKTIIISFLVLGLTTLFIGYVNHLFLLLLLQFLQGISGYLILIVLMGESVAFVEDHNRGIAMGLFQSIFGIGMFIGPILSGVLHESYGSTTTYLLFSILASITALFSGSLLKNNKHLTPNLYNISDSGSPLTRS